MALAPIILSHKMEKQTSNDPSGDTKDMDDLKASRMPSAARDVALGQMLEVEATPEQERRVVWKLDLVYVLVYWFSRINLTNQIDTHDGRVLYDAVYGQIRLESGNIVQLARGSCMLSFRNTPGFTHAYRDRTSKVANTAGHHQCSTLDILLGVGRVPI